MRMESISTLSARSVILRIYPLANLSAPEVARYLEIGGRERHRTRCAATTDVVIAALILVRLDTAYCG